MFEIIVLTFTLSLNPTNFMGSPWQHPNNELADNVTVIPGSNPIQYPMIWERERELFGYNPRFLPNIVTFDFYNRPVIRVGVHDPANHPNHATLYHSSKAIDHSYIQTLNIDGEWITLSLSNLMEEKVANWNNDQIYSGSFQGRHEMVVFDGSGDAYTIVKSANNGSFLLHGNKDMTDWDVKPLGYHNYYQMERNATSKCQAIFAQKETKYEDTVESIISLILLQKDPAGILNIQEFEITSDLKEIPEGDKKKGHLFGAPSHSGMGDLLVTVGNKTHIVYGSTRHDANDATGTPQYIVTFNHIDQIPTAPFLLGTTKSLGGGNKTDVHNGPAIVVDSGGFLHVMLGSHNQPFKYLKSLHANRADEWTEAVEVRNIATDKHTYVSLVIDPEDTLHLVSRKRAKNSVNSLHYMQKKTSDSSWIDKGELVISKPEHYSIWYHKLTVDEKGRLFLTYFYYSNDFTCEEHEAYEEKWPEECPCDPKAHDPVILMSSDGGSNWNLAQTANFMPDLTINNQTPEALQLILWTNNGSVITDVPAETYWLAPDNLVLATIHNTNASEQLQVSVTLDNGINYDTIIPPNGGAWAIPMDVLMVRRGL